MQVDPEPKAEESKPANNTPVKPTKADAGMVRQGKYQYAYMYYLRNRQWKDLEFNRNYFIKLRSIEMFNILLCK
jgi:hypothetical protein